MKVKFLSFVILMAAWAAQAQITTTTVTIRDIQIKTLEQLQNCDDLSAFENQTVTVRGRMPMSAVLTYPPLTIGGFTFPGFTSTAGINANGRELYIQAGNGPWSGIMVRANSGDPALTPFDMLNAVAGDSVEVVGRVNNFQGMTQIYPITFRRLLTSNLVPNVPPLIDGQRVEGIAPRTVTVAELNGPNAVNKLTTGEQWEGMFVELRDLTVVNVTPNPPIDPNSNVRVRIICEDADGNQIQVYDRFRAGRIPGESAGRGRLEVPLIGARYSSLRGMLTHTKNNPTGQTCEDITWSTLDQGYQLHPFYYTHYQLGDAPPALTNLRIEPLVPSTSQNVTISVDATALNPGVSVAGVSLYYSFDTANVAGFTEVVMTRSGSTWSGVIPSTNFNEGSRVYYYLKATDSRATPLVSLLPRVPVSIPGVSLGRQNPYFFVVRNGGLKIRDVQFTPFNNGRSAYENFVVTLSGVITATPSIAGFVAMQDDDATEWGGIIVENNTSFLDGIRLGQRHRFIGRIAERQAGASTFTVLTDLQINRTPIPLEANVRINPVVLNSTVLGGNYDFAKHEKYEGMLVALVNGTANEKLFVVDTNADAPSNFSEFRVGPNNTILGSFVTISGTNRNTLIPGTRVLAGRVPVANSPNSLRFSLITRPTLLANNSVNPTAPDTAQMKLRGVKPIIVNTNISMDTLMGIVNHSFGNMKLLPRDNNDVKGLNVDVATSLYKEAIIYVKLYPNPTDGILTVDTQLPQYTVCVYNVLGVKVLEDKMALKGYLDIRKLPSGLYYIKVEYNDQSAVSKIYKY